MRPLVMMACHQTRTKKYHSAILISDQAVATASQAPSEDGMLQFNEGDVILVLSNDTQEVGVCTFLTFSLSAGGFCSVLVLVMKLYLWSVSHIEGWTLTS